MNTHKSFLAVSLVVYVLQCTGCGVLLYPERQGQKGGRIDPAIAILDGIGLLLFLIPGLVAFAIDFHQGTIYLPGGHSSDASPVPGLRAVKVDGPMTEENIERVLCAELGKTVDISGANVQALRIDSDQLSALAQLALADEKRKTF